MSVGRGLECICRPGLDSAGGSFSNRIAKRVCSQLVSRFYTFSHVSVVQATRGKEQRPAPHVT